MKASRLVPELLCMAGVLAICVTMILAEMGLVDPVWFFASIPTPLLLLFPALMASSRLAKREMLEERREFERRHRPLRDIVDEHRRMEGSEGAYRQQLVRSLIQRISTTARLEAPLPTGTRVDIALEYGGDDWFITIKKGLNNQKRLVLQGEIEDILRHAPRKGRDLWSWS